METGKNLFIEGEAAKTTSDESFKRFTKGENMCRITMQRNMGGRGGVVQYLNS